MQSFRITNFYALHKVFIAEEKLFTLSIILLRFLDSYLCIMYLQFLERIKFFMGSNNVKAQSVLDTHHGGKFELTEFKLPKYKQVLHWVLVNVEFKKTRTCPL